MWYDRLSEYPLKEGFENNPICPCVFIKKSEFGFAIVTVYVNDLNLVGTPEELTKTADYLKNEFEMKDLSKIKFCLDLQIEHLPDGILIHQSTYTEKVLKHFHMDKAHPLRSSMLFDHLMSRKILFALKKLAKKLLVLKYYTSVQSMLWCTLQIAHNLT